MLSLCHCSDNICCFVIKDHHHPHDPIIASSLRVVIDASLTIVVVVVMSLLKVMDGHSVIIAMQAVGFVWGLRLLMGFELALDKCSS